jgi:hypothetical protein
MTRRPKDQFELARLKRSDDASVKRLQAGLDYKKRVERQLAQLGRVSKMPLSEMIEGECDRG